MSEKELVSSIEKIYGFKKELISNARQCGLWHVRFTVNNINFYGCISHAGAEPVLMVEGYQYQYYWHGGPVKEAYYKEFIEGKTIYLTKCMDEEAGVWKYQEVTFCTPGEAEEYIKRLDNPRIYSYEIKD